MMFFFTIVCFVLSSLLIDGQSLLRCDFESPCIDFTSDMNWGVTDGLHPLPIDHDHTLQTSAGHYLFYQPITRAVSGLPVREIVTTSWFDAPSDRAVCFFMWYFTTRHSLPFTVQLLQGHDEQLSRTILSIPGKARDSFDWAPINVTLPAERVKIIIRLNTTNGPLVFDDLSVDYCDAPRPAPPNRLFTCDFESSSCTNQLTSLPYYPYQWSVIEAGNASQLETQAPSTDFTYGNASGHYSWLENWNMTGRGNVGYLVTNQTWNITSNISYCLNFQYYAYGQSNMSSLKVFSWTVEENGHDVLQLLWPNPYSRAYKYTSLQWTWSVINLPVGNYALLFRMDSLGTEPSTFALDNLDITSCAYPPYQSSSSKGLLTFDCDFDDCSMCGMKNGERFTIPTYNFTVFTGDTVPDPALGPNQDHTTNSPAGVFLYWDRRLPFAPTDFGLVHTVQPIEQNAGMCVQFAYYIKSMATNKYATTLMVNANECYSMTLWSRSMDDSLGWQLVTIPVEAYSCAVAFSFFVTQQSPVAVSVAIDDIRIEQCDALPIPSNATTPIFPTSTQSDSTTRSPGCRITTATTQSTITMPSTTSTSMEPPTSTKFTTKRNNAQHFFLDKKLIVIVFSILYFIVPQH